MKDPIISLETLELLNLFFEPHVSSILSSRIDHNLYSVKNVNEIKLFCYTGLNQGINCVSKNSINLPDDVLNYIKTYLFKEQINYNIIKDYWYNKYLIDLYDLRSEDLYDMMWYDCYTKDYDWAHKRFLMVEATIKATNLKFGYNGGKNYVHNLRAYNLSKNRF